MFCSKCGNEIFDEAVVCPKCGCPTSNYNSAPQKEVIVQEEASVGLIICSILVPIIGVVLGIVNLVQKQTKKGTVYLLVGIVAWVLAAMIISML